MQKVISGNAYNNAGVNITANKFGVTGKNNLNFPTPVRFPSIYDFAEQNPKFITVAATSGSPIVVAAIPGRKIRLVAYTVTSSTAQGAKWQSNTTDISGNMLFAASSQISNTAETGLIETATGEALRLLPDGAGTMSGHITYWIR